MSKSRRGGGRVQTKHEAEEANSAHYYVKILKTTRKYRLSNSWDWILSAGFPGYRFLQYFPYKERNAYCLVISVCVCVADT